jgi:hypothetical protein
VEPVILFGEPRSGYGDGSGSGSGYGYGYSSGDGSGYSYGYGDGYGSGYGSGYSYGSGSGSGYGSGDGYGYGSGDGYGYGDGSWEPFVPAFAGKLSDVQTARLGELKNQGATIAYWCSDAKGKPCNGGSGKPVSAGHVDTEPGPLSLCSPGTLHATHFPQKWKGDRWWIVALIGEVVSDGEKFGALKREVIGECLFDA